MRSQRARQATFLTKHFQKRYRHFIHADKGYPSLQATIRMKQDSRECLQGNEGKYQRRFDQKEDLTHSFCLFRSQKGSGGDEMENDHKDCGQG